MKLLLENWRKYLNESNSSILKVAGIPLNVEVASDEESIKRGLMHREHLDPNSGMLFIFPEPSQKSFWMKDTGIPLSIAYIDEDNKILNIEDMMPYDINGVKSHGKAKCAIEANRGWFESNGILTSETTHRGKLSVLTLMIGMGLSFLIQSYFMKSK